MKENYVIGIDIGGTNFRIAAVRLEHAALTKGELGAYRVYRSHFRKVPVGTVLRTARVLEYLAQYLEQYCEMLGREGKRAAAVVIGFPATLDRSR